jgi:hypothetical protein
MKPATRVAGFFLSGDRQAGGVACCAFQEKTQHRRKTRLPKEMPTCLRRFHPPRRCWAPCRSRHPAPRSPLVRARQHRRVYRCLLPRCRRGQGRRTRRPVRIETPPPHIDASAPIVGYPVRSAENLTDRSCTGGYFAAECLVFLLLLDSRHQARTWPCHAGLFYVPSPLDPSDSRINRCLPRREDYPDRHDGVAHLV